MWSALLIRLEAADFLVTENKRRAVFKFFARGTQALLFLQT